MEARKKIISLELEFDILTSVPRWVYIISQTFKSPNLPRKLDPQL